MKKIFFLLFSLIAFSCSVTDSVDPNVKEKLDMTEFNKLGQAQLVGIKQITTKIDQARNSSARVSNEYLMEVVQDASIEYIESLDLDYETEQQVIQLMLDIYDNPIQVDFESIVNSMVYESHKNYMYQIKNAIESSASPDVAINKLNIIEESANVNLSTEDAFVIISATTSAKYQIDYWYGYLGNNSSNGRVACVSSWSSVGKAAIAGAAGGAASCGAARFFGPVGWKVWGACIVGGAAGAAVYEAVIQCIN